MRVKYVGTLCFGLLLSISVSTYAEAPLYTFAVLGDSGADNGAQKKVAEQMTEWYEEHPFQLVLMLGDNIYDYGFVLFIPRSHSCTDKRLWKVFDKHYGSLRDKGVHFFSVLGNHDRFCRGKMRAQMMERFGIPGESGYGTFSPHVTAEGRPLITFYALNSNRMVKGNEDPDQVSWLVKEARNDRSIWKVGMTHHPVFMPGGKHQPKEPYKSVLPEALSQGGVQLLLSGHAHYYARMEPVDGLVQIISGGGGRSLHTPRKKQGVAIASRAHHFVYMEVFPRRIDFRAVDSNGEIIEKGTIDLTPAP